MSARRRRASLRLVLPVAAALALLGPGDPGGTRRPACAEGGTGAAAPGAAARLSPSSPAKPQKMHILRSFRNAHGQRCRVIEQRVLIDGRRVPATATICRQRHRWTLMPLRRRAG